MIYDGDGNILNSTGLRKVTNIINGYAKAIATSGWGILDRNGRPVTAFDYDEIGQFNTDYVWFRKNGLYGLFNKDFSELVPATFKGEIRAILRKNESLMTLEVPEAMSSY